MKAMKLKVANGGPELAVSDENFGREYNPALVFQVVNAYVAAGQVGMPPTPLMPLSKAIPRRLPQRS